MLVGIGTVTAELHTTKFGGSGLSSYPSMQCIEKMGKFLQCTQETCHE